MTRFWGYVKYMQDWIAESNKNPQDHKVDDLEKLNWDREVEELRDAERKARDNN